MEDLLKLHQPWDCERFPKSKTICYGGGGSVGNLGKVVKPSLKGLDLTKSTGYLSPKGVKAITSSLKAAGAISGYTELMNEKIAKERALNPPKKSGGLFGGISISPPKITTPKITVPKITTPKITTPKVDIGSALTGVTSGITASANTIGKAVSSGVSGASNVISSGVENIKKEGNKAVNQIKTEAGKLAKGDFSLKNAVTGTVSGASETFKKSDAGKVTKKIAKETGYTGSDFDKAVQKVEKEGANIVNQTLDFVDSPGKVVLSNIEKTDQYIKDRLGINTPTSKELLAQGVQQIGKSLQKKKQKGSTSSSSGPGQFATIGSGSQEGMRSSATMMSGRQRAKQNKRALRIASR